MAKRSRRLKGNRVSLIDSLPVDRSRCRLGLVKPMRVRNGAESGWHERVRRPVRALLASLAAAVAALALAPTAPGAAPRVLAIEFENDVNPVTADYVVGELERAERERFDAVVILLDTPGGLDTSMRAVIKAELAAKVPVIVYVHPPGARAASAGAFLTMAAAVAAMAPQTNTGSSTPVNVSGEEIPDDLRDKIVNDAAAYIAELAEEHGRNGDAAEEFVREASNLGAREAARETVVDVVAPDLRALSEADDGRRTKQ